MAVVLLKGLFGTFLKIAVIRIQSAFTSLLYIYHHWDAVAAYLRWERQFVQLE